MWEQTQQQVFRVTAREEEYGQTSSHVVSLGVEALKKGNHHAIEYGDPDSRERRAAYGPSNNPEPDYYTLGSRLMETGPFPDD